MPDTPHSHEEAPKQEELPLQSVLPALTDQIYGPNDLNFLQNLSSAGSCHHNLKTLDELIQRDEKREKDGFHRKVNVGKIVKPGKGKNKVVIVPTTTEEKFYHDNRPVQDSQEFDGDEDGTWEVGETTGTADGEEGDVIGEIPIDEQLEGEGEGGSGQGDGGDHETGASAYDLGKVLTEKFQLPNLKEKGTKKSLTKYVYDLTDRNRGEGQILDKQKTLIELIKTNIHLGTFDPSADPDMSKMLINKRDFIYRIMSREQDIESQAVVFFVRDYSGSMHGKPTEIVGSQHVMIYSWLMYQYKENVDTRFILHDTDAKEVDDFETYHGSNVSGGTRILSALKLVNEIVKEENLAKDNNIYIFYGGDGDDWNTEDEALLNEFHTLLQYVNRIGVIVVKGSYGSETSFERFLKEYDLVEKNEEKLHLDIIPIDADDMRIIESLKQLVS